ncbi:MAG: hypothetical protein E7609_06100 [Ruminococcaceae bacterium]|nr:hypothetical protein [Oscillospiraceae bacterium]
MGDALVPTAGVMQVTKTTDDGGNVAYGIGYNNAATPTVTFAVDAAMYLELSQKKPSGRNVETGRRFSLFNTMPATVYAIRVYNRALTDAEKLHNSFIDKAAFYQLEIDGFTGLDAAKKENIYNYFATVGFDADATELQARYNFYAAGSADALTEGAISFTEILPILANASGYRALFSVNKLSLDLLEDNGYTVTFGALVAPATAANVELGADGVKNIVVGGEGGSGIFYQLAHAGGWYYSAAITADDVDYYGVDMVVRGYVTVEKDGKSYTAYDNASLEGVEQISILDAADYFVNKFDGDIVTQYKYMNSAALRAILAEYGYDARVSLDDDLVIYVDAASANGDNNGLTKDTAYTTIGAAFDAAKAHLAKTGRKTVTIQLGEGTYYVTETMTLSAEDILADEYSFEVVGSGNTTVLTSEVEIEYNRVEGVTGGLVEGEFGYYVQLPQNADGSYPYFRALYADGKLVGPAHKGDSEETWRPADFYITESSSRNPLTDVRLEIAPTADKDNDGVDETVDTDWALSTENVAKAKYAVFKLPVAMLSADEYGDWESYLEYYDGAELHMVWDWEASVVSIDHIEKDPNSNDYVYAYAAYENFPSGFHEGHYIVKHTYVWFENSPVFMALEGNGYYYDAEDGQLYYPDALATKKLTYASLENLFVLDNVRNISFKNLTMTGVDSDYLEADVGLNLGQAGSLTLREGGEETSIGFIEHAAIFGTNVTGLDVQNVSIRNVLGAGITVKGHAKDIVIDSSSFENIGGSAIQLAQKDTYAKNVEITDNYVNNTGTLYQACAGIMTADLANAKIIGNTVTNTTWCAVSVGLSWSVPQSTVGSIVNGGEINLFNVEIAYNYVTNMMTCTGDGGAFYLNGGAVSRGKLKDLTDDDDSVYNYIHHNYVVMSNECGLRGDNADGYRKTYCYYFECSSSNWLSYENVLVNEVNKLYPNAKFYGVYLQREGDSEEGAKNAASHITMVGNYYIGFNSVKQVFNIPNNPNPDFAQVANDYVYASVADLENSKTLAQLEGATDDTTKHNSATCMNSPAGAGAIVAGIYGACGTTNNTAGKTSGLNATLDATPKADRVILNDAELVNLPTFGGITPTLATVTFVEGETQAVVKGAVGTSVSAPLAFAQPGYRYTFYDANGNEIDLATFAVPADGATITVVSETDLRTVTIRGGKETVKVGVAPGETFELPAILVEKGKVATLTVRNTGAVVDLATFKMPDADIEMLISYVSQMYSASFDDGKGTKVDFIGYFGEQVVINEALFTKEHYTTSYKIGDEVISLDNLTLPEGNIEITVVYTPIKYTVTFIGDLSQGDAAKYHTYGTIEVEFGQLIDASSILTPDIEGEDGLVARFVAWEGFVAGDTTLNADNIDVENGTVFWAKIEWVTGLALGDIDRDGEITMADVTELVAIISGAPKPSGVTVDLDGDGEVTMADVTELVAIISGSAS